MAECLMCWTCDQQVVGSNSGHCAIEYNPGQIVYIHVSVTKQHEVGNGVN